MNTHRHPLSSGLTLIAAALLIAVPAAAAQAADAEPAIATEQLGGTTLAMVPQIAYESATLRVSGPDSHALTKTFEASGAIHVDLLADQEVRPVAQEAADTAHHEAPPATLVDGIYNYEVAFYQVAGSPQVHTGTFLVEGGSTVPLAAKRSEPTAAGGESPAAAEGAATQEEPSPQATENDFISIEDAAGDGQTFLALKSTLPSSNHWALLNTSGTFGIWDDGTPRLSITPNSHVGIGTTVPQTRLDVASPPGFCAVQLSHPAAFSRLCTFSNGELTIQTSGGGVGIGTTLNMPPEADLEIRNIDGSANTAIRITNEDNTWVNGVRPDGNFVFNKAGSGGAEFTVRERNHPTATLDVQGHVRGTSFISTSSRTLKTAFAAVEPLDVLGKLAALPVSAWRYKTESEGKRHIGPVAEDFQRLFGLGDGKTIATVDADGVLMAAVQGVIQKMEHALAVKDAEIAALKTDVEHLKEAIASR